MKHLFVIGGLFLLLLMGSCSQGEKTVDDSLIMQELINVNFVEHMLHGNQFLKKSRIISLSSEHDEALIAEVDRLLVGNDRYFVMDRRTNRLMAFDGQGKFIASTSRYIGEGPDSYTRITDVTIDNKAKKVYAHCDAPYCLMVFDMNLQLEKKIGLDYYMLEISDDDKYIYGLRAKNASNFGYELVVLDKADLSAEPTIMLETTKAIYGAGAIGKRLTSSGQVVNVCLPFDNVVYQLSNKEIIARYPLYFGRNGVDYSDIKGMTMNQFYKSPYREKIWSVVNVYSSDSTLFFGCNGMHSFTLNRKTKECVGFSSWRNDLIPYSTTQTLSVDGLPHAYAYLWPSLHVMNFKSHMPKDELDADFQKILEGYEEEDNPLIVVCEMK